MKKVVVKRVKVVAGAIFLSIFVLILAFAVYFDQSFEPENIEELRETVHASVDVLPPEEFTTDGCSLWLDTIFENNITDICVDHDIEYWKGGSEEEREEADSKLRERINERIPFLGDLMYLGVRVFGDPFVPTPWGWGYGSNVNYE